MTGRDHQFTKDELLRRAEIRKAYNTPSGRMELLRNLVDWGTFRQISEADLALRNYGIHKLEELGFLDIELLEEFIHWLFSRPLAYRPTVEELGEDIYKDPLDG